VTSLSSLCAVAPPTRWGGLPVLLGALLGWGPATSAQVVDNDPVFTVYGMEAGLSQSSVYALLQDRTGFLWIGTQDGLNRFDGVDFRPFKHVRDDSTSLSDDLIRSLALNVDGRIWVGTERGGLNLFDPRTGEAVRHPLEELGPWRTYAGPSETPRTGRTVGDIALLPDRTLLLSTDAGLARFLPSTQEVIPLPVPEAEPGPAPAPILCVSPGEGAFAGFPDGSVWLIRSDARPEKLLELTDGVRALRCPRGGEGFLATGDGSVYTLSGTGRQASRLLQLESSSVDEAIISDVFRGPSGLLWIATSQGLFYSRDNRTARRAGARIDGRGLRSNEITEFMVDHTGMLWIGTWNGLASVHPLSHSIRRIPVRTGASPGLSGHGVVAMEEGEDGALWIGTMGGGVDRLEPGWRGDSVTVTRPAALQAYDDARILDLGLGPEGRLWIAALSRSFLLLDPQSGRTRSVPVAGPDGTVLSDVRAYSVLLDRAGSLWAGTGFSGLARYHPASRRFETYQGPGGDWDFGSTWIWPLAEDAQGRLWVGAFAGGLTSIDPHRRSVRFYPAAPSQLSDDRILTLFAGSRGFLWIGTQGGGLNRLDPETDDIRVYTVEDGLPHDHVEGIVEDDLGFLWITTNDGLARLDPESSTFWILKESAGLAGDRFFANAAYKDVEGNLLFGGPDGLTILDPTRVYPNRRPPDVALTGFRIHGRSQPLDRILDGGRLDLGSRENFFSFEFAALDFKDPTLNRYRYMLEGVDRDWVENGSSRTARYTSVPPGRYVFRVAARNADGVWNEGGLSIPVRLRPPYYEAWWFRSLVGGSLLLLATWTIYRRVREHRRRLDVAGRLHDGIGANIASILRAADRTEAGLAPDDPGREELDRVRTLARRAQTEMRAAVRILRRGKETETLAALMKELMDTADWMLHRNVRYDVRVPDPLPNRTIHWKARPDVVLLFNEMLNNVLKHAQATYVDVSLEYDAPHLRIRVRDDGKGFEASGESDGHGRRLMREHAKRHHGDIRIDSVPGEGTTVEAWMRIR